MKTTGYTTVAIFQAAESREFSSYGTTLKNYHAEKFRGPSLRKPYTYSTRTIAFIGIDTVQTIMQLIA